MAEDVRHCDRCEDLIAFEDGVCTACGYNPGHKIVPVQAVEAYCRHCSRRTFHRVVASTLIRCDVCLLPQVVQDAFFS